MAVSGKERHNQKRAEARKSATEARQAAARLERLNDIAEEATYAFGLGDYRSALRWSLKRLESEPVDLDVLERAIYCAKAEREPQTLFTLLELQWTIGQMPVKADQYVLGELALRNKNFVLAREVFKDLLKTRRGLKRYLPANGIENAEKYLLYAEIMKRKLESAPAVPIPRSAVRTPEKEKSQKRLDASAVEEPRSTALTRPEEVADVELELETAEESVLEAMRNHTPASWAEFELALQGYKHSFRVSFDQLVCLPTLRNVESLWYQEEVARKVMKGFRGRAILADEVGLGKTIEAGLVLKEYLVRGLIRSALVLAPSSLVNQWQEELKEKFDLTFISSNEPLFREDPGRFWEEPFIVASLNAARNQRHFGAVTSRSYDLVIVDEAHHLKNQSTQSWKLVNALQKTFILLLTATPVQNDLEELYNLVTILKPGHLKTRKHFKEQFVARGNPTDPRNRERLRELLKEVMIRNTRSIAQVSLPVRFAYTTRVSPSEPEMRLYQGISALVNDYATGTSSALTVMAFRKLLEAAGSSHYAAMRSLEKLGARELEGIAARTGELLDIGRGIGVGSKAEKVIHLLKSSPEQKIVFVNYVATLEHLRETLARHRIPHAVFSGGLSQTQKRAAIEEFRGGCPILLATGVGGEGHNLQFCHVIINYDLPWNPMEIEQRIGRIHRIGQKEEVRVYNFCAAGSVEDHILNILDRKINMFELVVGELDMILGRVQDEKDFADMVFEIWSRNPEEEARSKAFDSLASRLRRAKNAYEKSKELDEKLFQEDFGS